MDLTTHPVYFRMKHAVAQTAPEKVAELEKIAKSYAGDARLLGIFLDRFGSNNPWEAAAQAKLEQVIFRTSKELQEEGEIGISESGHRLLQEMYVLRDPENEAAVWRSGAQAITRIMEAFGSAEEKARYAKKEPELEQLSRPRRVEEAVRSLEEVLEDPSKIRFVQSINDRRQILKIMGLKEELWKHINYIDRLRYSSELDEIAETPFRVAADAGGTFLGWFKRRIEEEAELDKKGLEVPNRIPPAVRDMYTTVVSPVVSINEEERRRIIHCLLLYAAANRYVRREAAIGSYEEDFNFLSTLSREHPVLKEYGSPSLVYVEDILQRSEITLLEAARIFDIYPIDRVRAKMNAQSLQSHQEEFNSILSRLRPLFIKDERWQEDSLGASIPLERLKKTIYFAALQREDFLPVRDLLRLYTLTGTELPGETELTGETDLTGSRGRNINELYMALSMREFKNKVRGVVVAARKVKFMDDFFNGNVLELAGGKKPISVPDPKNAEEIAKQWKGAMIRGLDLDLAEHFPEEHHHLSLEEFLHRLDFVVLRHRKAGEEGLPRIWEKQKGRMVRDCKYGLYSQNLLSEFQPYFEAVYALTPWEQAQETMQMARQAVQHPLVKTFLGDYLFFAQPYLEPGSMGMIQEIASIGEELTETRAKYGLQLQERRAALAEVIFYDGAIDKRIELRKKTYEDKEREQARFRDQTKDILRYVEPAQVEALLRTIEVDYVLMENLSPTWKAKASFLTSTQSQPLLRREGLALADPITFEEVRTLGAGRYVQNSFVEDIDKLYQRVEQTFSALPKVIKTGRREFEEADLYARFDVTVKGTSVRDAGRFRETFSSFHYQQKERSWVSREPLSKGVLGLVTEQLQEYNIQHGTTLALSLKRNPAEPA